MTSNIRRAILLAANRVAKTPRLFRFCEVAVPPDCKTPGCFLGWVRYYMGQDDSRTTFNIAPPQMGVSDGEFYSRMDKLSGFVFNTPVKSRNWRHSGKLCAKIARLYADEFHPLGATASA